MYKNKVKRFICVVTALVMILVLPACNSGNQNENSKTIATTQAEKPLLKVSVITPAGSPIKTSDETDVGKVIKEKFNIVFEYLPYAGSELEKQNLMLAAGDYPDIISLRGEDIFQKYLKAGVSVELDKYLDKMPNFKKLFATQIPYWRLSDKDGKLFKWEGREPVDPKVQLSANEVLVRSDVLEKQGYPKLKTTTDYVNFIRQGMKDFPKTGDKSTIGMAVPFAESYGMIGIGPILFEKGETYPTAAGRTAAFNAKKEQFESLMDTKEAKESLLFFNQLYREGFLDRESFTDKASQVTAKCDENRPIAVWYTIWCAANANNVMIKKGDTSKYYVHLPIQSPSQVDNGEKRSLTSVTTNAYESIIITNKAKSPERIVELLDWSCSDEGLRVLLSGIKDKHYTIVNGKVKMTDEYYNNMYNAEYVQKTGIGTFTVLATPHIVDANGNPYRISAISDDRILALKARETEIYGKYGYKSFIEMMNGIGKSWEMGLSGSVGIAADDDLGKLNAMLQDYMTKNLPKTIMTPKNDTEFNTIWNQFVEGYNKLEPKKVIDELNKQYSEKKSKLNELKKK